MKKRMLITFFTVLFVLAGVVSVFAASSKTPVSVSSQQRVLIVFKDKVNPSVVSDAKGQVLHELKNLPVLTATVPTAAINGLKNNPNIASIELDVPIKVKAQTVDWGQKDIQAPTAWSNGNTGSGVKVAVIDTGIASHEDLTVAGGVSMVSYTTSYADDNGHGTHVAGIIGARNNTVGVVGVAPDASLYAVKVLDANGSGYLSDVVAGIDWAITNKMDVVNLSLGSATDSSTLHQAVDTAYNNGILVAAAAGNDGGTNTVEYPAKYTSVIAVSAVDSSNNIASFSSTGSEVEVAAPGVNILSTYLNNAYATMSGTSMATPMVAGKLALLKQSNPTASAVTLRSVLDQQVLDLGVAGRDTLYGYGLIQAVAKTTQTLPPVTLATTTKVITDKTAYLAGETVTVTVTVVDQNGTALSGATVNLAITPPKGSKLTSTAKTNTSGQAVFKLATSRKSIKGTYQVSANTSLTNYTSSSATTSYQLK